MIGQHIIVTGEVQGVFFRQSAKEEAERLGLTGWVHNLSDGSVEINAFGKEAAIAEFINWCQKGSTQANVENVHSEPMDYEVHPAFIIKG